MASDAGTRRRNSSQACQMCRSLKVKCIPSGEGRVCQKCRRAGTPCTWAEPQHRPRKTKSRPRTRIAVLEEKLEKLIAEVTYSKQPSAASPDIATIYPSPESGTGVRQKRTRSDEGTEDSTDIYGSLDLLSKYHLSVEEAEKYVRQYREMSLYFPFVILPLNITIASLDRDRPLLLHAVLAAASQSNRKLQSALENDLRRSVLERVLLNGEMSLELLSALLVYLGWYHFYYIPKQDTVSQLLHLTISMCYGLGLNLTPEEAVTRKVRLHLEHYRKFNILSEAHDAYFSREARRLFLGCYYYASSLSWINGGTSVFPYTEYMRDCASSLATEKEFPTDEAILALVQLQHMAEEHHEIMLMARASKHTTTSLSYVHTQLGSIKAQLLRFQNSVSAVLRQSTFFDLALSSAAMHTHEMELINPFANKKFAEELDLQSHTQAIPNSGSVRLKVLLRCLEAAKDFSDSFLTIPATEYRQLSSTQWYALIYATVVLYKLSIGIPTIPEWDVHIARSMVSIENFLSTCCARMEIASAGDRNDTRERKSLFDLMSPIWGNVKETYERLKQLPQDQSSRDTGEVHAPSFPSSTHHLPGPATENNDVRESVQTATHRCPAFPFWKGQAGSIEQPLSYAHG